MNFKIAACDMKMVAVYKHYATINQTILSFINILNRSSYQLKIRVRQIGNKFAIFILAIRYLQILLLMMKVMLHGTPISPQILL